MDDLISRQAAIDIVVFECGKWTGFAKEISKQLKQLPSAQPERAEGEWIVHLYKVGVSRYECDACHARCDIIYPYCPYCGEKKEGERDAIN